MSVGSLRVQRTSYVGWLALSTSSLPTRSVRYMLYCNVAHVVICLLLFLNDDDSVDKTHMPVVTG